MTDPSGQPARWRKSSYSGSGNNCVEVAPLPAGISVRDSKNADGPQLAFTPAEWRAFIAAAKTGHYDPAFPTLRPFRRPPVPQAPGPHPVDRSRAHVRRSS